MGRNGKVSKYERFWVLQDLILYTNDKDTKAKIQSKNKWLTYHAKCMNKQTRKSRSPRNPAQVQEGNSNL
jgi:hypothetical protein